MFKNLRTSKKLLEICLNSRITLKRNAGHSKWQNIRHIKAEKDTQKSNLFHKLSRQMKAAIQEGGSPDPSKNLKLEHIVEQAKRSNMPASTLQNILKNAQTDKNQCKNYLLEIKGPGSCILLCEIFTEHLHHSKSNIQTVLKKHMSKFSDGGGIHQFEQKGVVVAEIKTNEGDILETATDDAIESGAEDVQLIENNLLEFTCGASCLKSVTNELEKRNYTISSASVEYIPNRLQLLNEQELEMCSKLFDKLESLQEVVKISDNIAV